MQYEVTGQYPAADFFDVNIDTGVVTIKKPLREDTLRLPSYTLVIVAYDDANPLQKVGKTLYCTFMFSNMAVTTTLPISKKRFN